MSADSSSVRKLGAKKEKKKKKDASQVTSETDRGPGKFETTQQ
jgi:hypothetical protein